MLHNILSQTDLAATRLDLALRITPADRASQEQILCRMGGGHAIPFGEDIDRVLGHAPVGR